MRLKQVVTWFIGGFIQRRSILYSIMICEDVLKICQRKGVSPRFIMKMDLKKAYNTVKWGFIDGQPLRFEFPYSLLQRIMAFLARAIFPLILINPNTYRIWNAWGQHSTSLISLVWKPIFRNPKLLWLVSPRQLNNTYFEIMGSKEVDQEALLYRKSAVD